MQFNDYPASVLIFEISLPNIIDRVSNLSVIVEVESEAQQIILVAHKPLSASPCQGRSMALPLTRGSWRGFVLGVAYHFRAHPQRSAHLVSMPIARYPRRHKYIPIITPIALNATT